jgi:hypothetical protein
MLAAIINANQAVGASREEIDDWAEKKVRNEIDGGLLLAGVERRPGARTDETSRQSVGRLPTPYQQALSEADLIEKTAERWQTMALLPDDKLEAYFMECRGDPKDANRRKRPAGCGKFNALPAGEKRGEPI